MTLTLMQKGSSQRWTNLNVKPVDPRILVEAGEEPIDVHAGHDHLRDQELDVQLELEETFLQKINKYDEIVKRSEELKVAIIMATFHGTL